MHFLRLVHPLGERWFIIHLRQDENRYAMLVQPHRADAHIGFREYSIPLHLRKRHNPEVHKTSLFTFEHKAVHLFIVRELSHIFYSCRFSRRTQDIKGAHISRLKKIYSRGLPVLERVLSFSPLPKIKIICSLITLRKRNVKLTPFCFLIIEV